MSSERLARLLDKAGRWVTEEGVYPALALLVARRGVIVIDQAFGRLTPAENSPPLSLDSIFPLASISKAILATQAMILVEQGELGLNRPVQYYLPEFTGPGKEKVMVHQLLTHTAGFLDIEMDPLAEAEKGRIKLPPLPKNQHPIVHEYLHLRFGLPLNYEPGSTMRYSNTGYEMMGEVIRRVSGRRLADFARTELFEPLGMQNTYYTVPDEKRGQVVHRPPGYMGAEALNSREWQDAPWAHGGVLSSVKDICALGQMFLNGGVYGETRILSPVTVAEMARNQIPGVDAEFLDWYFPEAGWGLGWALHLNKPGSETLLTGATFTHGGWGGTWLAVDPVLELVIGFFSVEQEWVEAKPYVTSRLDLFVNGVAAAIVD